MIDQARLAAWTPRLQAVLRIVTGLLFLEHGLIKVIGFPPGPPGQQVVTSVLGIAGLIEIAGGGLFILGLFTRVTAFIVSGEMAIAYFMVHAPHGLYPAVNNGDPAILFCFIFLFFAAAGSGAWSLDGLRQKPAAA